MSLRTRVRVEGETTIIHVDGWLDYENQDALRQDLLHAVEASHSKRDSVAKKIVVNLENLEFVGSSGITSFVQTLAELGSGAELKPRYCNVKSEFRRMMTAFGDASSFEFFETEERAKQSFDC